MPRPHGRRERAARPGAGRLPSRRRMVAETRALLDEIDTDIDPMRPAGLLSLAEQQLVLIVRALARQCRILILDEPTTSLTPHEVERLFTLLRRLRRAARRSSTSRTGCPRSSSCRNTSTCSATADTPPRSRPRPPTPRQVVEAMVGRTIAERVDGAGRTSRFDRCSTSTGCRARRTSTSASLCVRAGEIVGIAGLPDSGRSELVAALFGARRSTGHGLARRAPDPPALTAPRHRGRHRLRPGRAPLRGAVPRHDRGRERDVARDRLGGALRCRASKDAAPPRRAPAAGVRRPRPDRTPPITGSVRRQPAEDHPQPVARPPSRACSCSTTPPGASTSAPRPRSTTGSPRRRPTGPAC